MKTDATIREKIFIFGAGGHAKVVIDAIERLGNHEIVFLFDDDPALKGSEFYGYPVIGGKDSLFDFSQRSGVISGIVAIGRNCVRCRIADLLSENGFSLITVIHPSAMIARGVKVGAGTMIMPGAVVNADTSIGGNVIINSQASVDHDCIIGNGVHIAPGTILCGSVNVGERTLIGVGANVLPNITIGRDVIVGAAATVVKDLPDGVEVVGTPARVLQKKI